MKLLPKFEEIEDAEDFVERAFDVILRVAVIGISAIMIYFLLQSQPSEPAWWIEFEKAIGVTW